MLKSERKQLIMAKLKRDKFVSLDVLTKMLATSESTVRRDLDALESELLLRRVHGGAELPASLQEELTNQQKSIKNIQEKQLVAQEAAHLIADNEVIFIDAGTTNELLLNYLSQNNLTVVTNSIHHAAKLVDKSIQTIIIGGHVKVATDASIGTVAYEQIKQLNFDKAFLGINGVDEQFLTTPDVEEAVIKKTVIDNARKTFIVTDSSKIGHISFAKVDKVENVTIITNQSSNALMQKIKEKTRVIEV